MGQKMPQGSSNKVITYTRNKGKKDNSQMEVNMKESKGTSVIEE